MKSVIIIPTYNEAKNIEKLVSKILKLKENIAVVIVDDNSPDGTGEIADKLTKRYKGKIFAIHRKNERGIGSAFFKGLEHVLENLKVDYILEMDSDLSHDPKHLPNVLAKMKEGYDVVIGSRYVSGGSITGWGLGRKFISKVANSLSRSLLKVPVHDCTSGFRCYTTKSISSLNSEKITSNGYSFLLEVLYLLHMKGYKIGEVPIQFKDRLQGKSKLSKKELILYMFTVFRLRRIRKDNLS